MRINPINIYKTFSFNGQKDPDQPMAPTLSMIMHDRDVSQSKKKLLWELSEVPDFYKATKDTPISEFLQLADFISEKQNSNILEMALKGDVVEIKNSPNGQNGVKRSPLFSFSTLAQYNRTAPQSAKIGLLDYIKAHPVLQIVEDAEKEYKKFSVYPPLLVYNTEFDAKGNKIYKEIGWQEPGLKATFSYLANGFNITPQDTMITFDEKIKSKHSFDYNYEPINPERVENPDYIMPANLKIIFDSPTVPKEAIKSLYEMSENPYFYNLVKNTHPNVLLVLAGLNAGTKGLVTKMLNGDITLGVTNPEKNEEAKRPVIDIGKLLLERKQGKIKETGIIEILDQNTIAMEVCDLYSLFKQAFPNKEIKYIGLFEENGNLKQLVVTTENKNLYATFSKEHPIAQKLLPLIRKVPYKVLYLNYND